MKKGVQGKVLEPTVDQITAALRLCAVDEPAETYPCEQCYLYPYSKDGRMSTGRTCFEHLALDTCQLINRLNDFQNSQCAKLLVHITELESQLAESQRRERAAMEDITQISRQHLLGNCTFCKYRHTPDMRHNPCKGCRQPNGSCKNFEWRGPQEAGEGETE